MEFKLEHNDFVSLTDLYKKEKNKKRAERINIILLLHKGYTHLEVANILNLDQDTITKWKESFLQRTNSTDWLDTHYKSYFAKIPLTSVGHLLTYIDTCMVGRISQIRKWVSDSYGVVYTPCGISKLLKRVKFSYQTIHKLPGKCPVDQQQKWVDNFNVQLKTLSDKQTILFMDSVHPSYNTTYSKIWARKGKPRWIQSNTGREHLNISGLYNPITQETIIHEAKTINSEATIEILKKCAVQYADKEKVIIYLDNARYHKSEEVKQFLTKHDNIKLSFLPPYSPNLNLIERLWKFMKEKAINLQYYDTFSQFKEKLITFFKNIGQYKEELKNRITFNFQLFDRVSI